MVEEAMRAPLSVTSLEIRGDDVLRETGIKPGPEIGYILHALLEEVLDQPDLNNRDYLLARAKILAGLPKKELEKLGSSGKTKKERGEAEEIGKIRQKYWVK